MKLNFYISKGVYSPLGNRFCPTAFPCLFFGNFVVQVLIVITDGKQTTSKPFIELTVASQGIKDKGISVYAVGVGRGPDLSELQQIASAPENVFSSESYKGVISLAPPIRGKLCDCK